MHNKHYSIPFLLVSIFMVLTSCSTVPLTGRRQMDFIPGQMMQSVSFQQYDEFLKANTVSNDVRNAEVVKKVGGKIQKAVEEYMAANNMANRLASYSWEFNLIESKDINAWCMPGGKVVVYTGILPVAQNETGLAVIMGHEIAHAIARHGNERMSQEMLTEFGGRTLTAMLKEQPEKTQQLWLTVFGAGTELGILLPYSRLHENEADRLGLIFMAMAGYDPNKAVDFWQRMAKIGAGDKPPEFLSTHPSDEKRIEQIRSHLPEALQHYTPHVYLEKG